jgi:hypothetical protein
MAFANSVFLNPKKKGGSTMPARMEEDLMEDLGFDEAEGPAAMEDAEGYEEFDAADEADFGEEEEEWEGAEEDYFGEGSDEEGFDEGSEEFGEESDFGEEGLDGAVAYALGAEDTDEFFRRLMGGIRRVGRTVGRVARTAAPIASTLGRVASVIPHPYAQIAGRALTGAQPILQLLSQLRAEGASEEEAMDAFAELAAYDESALPVVAGLAARSILRSRAPRLPMPARRIIIRNIRSTARNLTRRRGPVAVRAIPRIARTVRRIAATRRTPVRAVARIVQRTAANVARNRKLIRRLSQPAPAAVRRVRRVVARSYPRTLTFRGPVRITISGAA